MILCIKYTALIELSTCRMERGKLDTGSVNRGRIDCLQILFIRIQFKAILPLILSFQYFVDYLKTRTLVASIRVFTYDWLHTTDLQPALSIKASPNYFHRIACFICLWSTKLGVALYKSTFKVLGLPLINSIRFWSTKFMSKTT